jgi:hypothetical protein
MRGSDFEMLMPLPDRFGWSAQPARGDQLLAFFNRQPRPPAAPTSGSA